MKILSHIIQALNNDNWQYTVFRVVRTDGPATYDLGSPGWELICVDKDKTNGKLDIYVFRRPKRIRSLHH